VCSSDLQVHFTFATGRTKVRTTGLNWYGLNPYYGTTGCIPLWRYLGRGRAPVPTLFGPKPGQPRGDCPYPIS